MKKLTTRSKTVKDFLYKLLDEHYDAKRAMKEDNVFLGKEDWAQHNSVYVYTSSNLNKIKTLMRNGVSELDIGDVAKEFSFDGLSNMDKLEILFAIDNATSLEMKDLEA